MSLRGDSREKLMDDQENYMNGMAEVIEDVAEDKMFSIDTDIKFADSKKQGAVFKQCKKDLMMNMIPVEGQALIEKFSKKPRETYQRYLKAVEKLAKSVMSKKELEDACRT